MLEIDAHDVCYSRSLGFGITDIYWLVACAVPLCRKVQEAFDEPAGPKADWDPADIRVIRVHALRSKDTPAPAIAGTASRRPVKSGKVRGASYTAAQMPKDNNDTSLWSHVICPENGPSVAATDYETGRVVVRVRYPTHHKKMTGKVRRLTKKLLENHNPVRTTDGHAGTMVAAGRRCLHGCETRSYSLKAGSKCSLKEMKAEVGLCGCAMTDLFHTWPEFQGVAGHSACSTSDGRPSTFSASRDLTNCPHCDVKVRADANHLAHLWRCPAYQHLGAAVLTCQHCMCIHPCIRPSIGAELTCQHCICNFCVCVFCLGRLEELCYLGC